jgi:hypothetical protein
MEPILTLKELELLENPYKIKRNKRSVIRKRVKKKIKFRNTSSGKKLIKERLVKNSNALPKDIREQIVEEIINSFYPREVEEIISKFYSFLNEDRKLTKTILSNEDSRLFWKSMPLKISSSQNILGGYLSKKIFNFGNNLPQWIGKKKKIELIKEIITKIILDKKIDEDLKFLERSNGAKKLFDRLNKKIFFKYSELNLKKSEMHYYQILFERGMILPRKFSLEDFFKKIEEKIWKINFSKYGVSSKKKGKIPSINFKKKFDYNIYPLKLTKDYKKLEATSNIYYNSLAIGNKLFFNQLQNLGVLH